MRETQPGVYLGEYAVLPGDSTRDMPIIAYLKRPSGPESQWIDTSGLVAMDTSAPGKVTGLRAKGFRDRVEVSWESLRDVPDLAAYRVLRSEQPLSGFQQIATTGVNAYEDRTARPGALYYYQVRRAGQKRQRVGTPFRGERADGNERSVDPVRGAEKRCGSRRDLSVEGQLIVPQGVSLTISPETTIVAEKDAGIVVQGSLTVDGSNGLVRLFSRRAERWTGIVLEGAQVAMKGAVLSGAQMGLTLRDAKGVIENVSVADNEVGIQVSGLSAVVVRNCWVAGNRTGIALVETNAKIVQSAIVRNGIGLSLRGFSGEISETPSSTTSKTFFPTSR